MRVSTSALENANRLSLMKNKMNGWLESGASLCANTFCNVNNNDLVMRTNFSNNSIVFCNGTRGQHAAMYVTENRVGVGMIPRYFTALDVHGSIFTDTRLEITNPSSQYKLVVDNERLYFSDVTSSRTPAVIDAMRASVLTNNVLVKETIGLISNSSIGVQVFRVVTSQSGTDIDVGYNTFLKIFNLESHVCIDDYVTKVVQFTILDQSQERVRVTLVPPLPTYIMSGSVVRVMPIQEPTWNSTSENRSHFVKTEVVEISSVDDYNSIIKCKGVWHDVVNVHDRYVAISTSELHNYQKVILVKSVERGDGDVIILKVTAPSLKNKLDLTEFTSTSTTSLFMYHLDYPDVLWSKEYNVQISFYVDSEHDGYYLTIDQSSLTNMLNTTSSLEHLNAIDHIVVGDNPELYHFTINKTYVYSDHAMLYIERQNVQPNVPTMFNGFYNVRYKFTGVPFLFNKIDRIDECTIRVECVGVQGYVFGDGMTLLVSDEYAHQYVLLNDTSCSAWRIIEAELGKGMTIRCADPSIVDLMVDEEQHLPRVVYALPMKGRRRPETWQPGITLQHGQLSLKDPNMLNADANITYDGKTLSLGPFCNLSSGNTTIETDTLTVNGSVFANDFTQLSDVRFKTNICDVDTKEDLEFVLGIELKEYDLHISKDKTVKKRGVIAQDLETCFGKDKSGVCHASGTLPDGTKVKDVRRVDMSMLLMRCIGAIQELYLRV